MSEIVQNQHSSWQAENSSKWIYNGFIYVGQVDTDPEIEANQVRVFYIDENEQEVDLAQPVRTNSSGFPVISETNSTVIQVRADNDYSVKALNRNGVEEWYIPKASTLSPTINIEDIPGLTEDLSERIISTSIASAKITSFDIDQLIRLSDRDYGLFRVADVGVPTDEFISISLDDGKAMVYVPENGIVNAIHIGAVGDGLTDDTQVIQIGGDYSIENKYIFLFPSTSNGYLCNEVVFDGKITVKGEGTSNTLIRPIQEADRVCWTINSSGTESSIFGITFSREDMIQNIGTAIKCSASGLILNDVEFIHLDLGVHNDENFFFHRYDNVYFRNNSSLLCDDLGDNNNNILTNCIFQFKIDIYGGNGLNFIGCDFSSNPVIGNRPFTFTDPLAVSFVGCYSEVLDVEGQTSLDMFYFKQDNDTGVSRNVTVYNFWVKGVSGKYDAFFSLENVNANFTGGYYFGYDEIAETSGSSEVVFFGVKKQSGTRFFSSASTGSVYENSTVRLGTEFSDPINRGEDAVSINNTSIEINNQNSSSEQSLQRLNKQRDSTSSTYIELLEDGNESGEIAIDSGVQVQVKSTQAGGRVELHADTGADLQRLDVYKAVVAPNNDGVADLGLTGQRFRNGYFVNAPTVTSDGTLKTMVDQIPSWLIDAAKELKGSIKIWKWLDRVNSSEDMEGDNARYHIGPIAQDIESIFNKHCPKDDNVYNYGIIGKYEKDGEEFYNIKATEILWLIVASI